MQILFVRSNKLGSRLIRYVTGEACSHVALRLDSHLVIHAKFSGVDVDLWETFKRDYEVVHTLEPTGQVNTEQIIAKLALNYEGSHYDYLGFFYLGLYLLAKRLGISSIFGQNNKWAKGPNYMCTELVGELVDGEKNSLLTPEQLKDKLVKTGNWTPSL